MLVVVCCVVSVGCCDPVDHFGFQHFRCGRKNCLNHLSVVLVEYVVLSLWEWIVWTVNVVIFCVITLLLDSYEQN